MPGPSPQPPAGDIPPRLDPGATPELLAEDAALLALLRTIGASPGEDCLRALTRSLAEALRVRYAVAAEFLPEARSARSLAFWAGDRFLDSVQWPIADTPCRAVVEGRFCLYPSRLREAFPLDAPLVELGAESYLGVPLMDLRSGVLGHLFVMDTAPMSPSPRDLGTMRIFGALAAAELTRRRLERSLGESEERYRDLFDEAPIAYVLEGLDTRFIRANRAAMRALGITPEEVPGTYGRSFVADNPENQRRLKEAFESVGRGADTSGVVLELRRRDNGKPLWIQWWSRPDRGGACTRTMFLDITDRVLMEQERARLQEQNRHLRDEIKSAHNYGDIVGSSPALRRVLADVERVAPTDSTVLITGETGTGKELVARALHDRSPRRGAPFVKVNCAALPAGLVESEFFGHEKGAFTGAAAARKGRFELADGGTIFLDEVGEVTPEVQVKLLRVLQESEFERVGGSRTIRVNVRVIAATNRDLAADAAAGRFRADLFYRLSVFPIRVPPLRERAADIPLLASYFVTQLAAAVGKRIDGIAPATLQRLSRYPWPGNIRELRNVLERAVILSEPGTLDDRGIALPDLDAPPAPPTAPPAAPPAAPPVQGAAAPPAPAPSGPPATLADAERAHILSTLQRTGGVIAGPGGAARLLGLAPSTLRSRMERLGIKP